MGKIERLRDVDGAFPWLRDWIVKQNFESSGPIGIDLLETINKHAGLVTQSDVEEIIGACAVSPPDLELGILLPFIPLDEFIEEFDFSVRPYNCLKREGFHVFGDLQGLTPSALGVVRNLGGSSLKEILEKLMKVNLEYSERSVTRMTRSRMDFFGNPENQPFDEEYESGSGELFTNNELAAIRGLGDWLSVSGNTDSFEILKLDPEIVDSLSLSALERDMKSVQALVARSQLGRKGIFDSLNSLSQNHRLLIKRRICSPDPETLQKLADEVSVTRERIRQIETSLKEHYLELVRTSPQCDYLAQYVKKAAKKMVSIESLRANLPNQVTYDQLDGLSDLDLIIGFEESVYVVDGFVTIHPEQKILDLIQEVSLSSNEVGLLTRPDFQRALSEVGDPEFLFELGHRRGLFTQTKGLIYPSRISLGDLTELVLSAEGKPMDYDELVDLVLMSRSPRSFRHMLFSDARFMRTSLTHWGLSVWGLEEYTNIRDEITEVLEEVGDIPLLDLAAELSAKFGVSPASVSAYAAAWPFQTINGIVSRTADTSVAYNRSLAENRDLFRVLGIPVIRVRYGSEQFRGSGTSLGKAAAIILGLEHGSKREIPINGLEGSLTVSFVSSQPNLGSVRVAGEKVQAEPDDHLLLFFGQKVDVKLLPKGQELSLAQVADFFGLESSSMDTEALVEMMREFLLLEKTDSLPGIFSALRVREEFALEADLRNKVGENEAYDLRLNLRSDSKFKIKSIDEVRKTGL